MGSRVLVALDDSVRARGVLSADLVVIGSHGYRGWDSVLGTTASSVANLSTRNVLVVHDRDSQREPGG